MKNRLERGIRSAIGPPRVMDESAAPKVSAPAATYRVSGGADIPQTEYSAMKLSAVNRCMEILSDSMAKLSTFAINNVTRQRIDDLDVLYLLNVRPNEAMTPSVRKKVLEGNRLSGGNGYDWIIRNPRTAAPVELIPLPWELVTPWRDSNGHIWYGVVHPWTGQPMVLPSTDVCHYKAYTHDGLKGISVLARAAEVITSGRSAQMYEQSFFQNGGYPSGILTADADLSGDVKRVKPDGTEETVTHRDIIREEWDRVHAGPQNAHRTAVLDLGLKYQPITISNVDAQFVESKGVTVEDIARFFGVPLSKLYAGKQAYNSNEQNSIDYVVSTLHPIVKQYEEEQTYQLLFESVLRKGIELKMNMMAELRGDYASRSAWYKAMREVGAFSADDIRALEDLPSIGEGGDIYYGNKNMAPLDQFRAISAAKGGNK